MKPGIARKKIGEEQVELVGHLALPEPCPHSERDADDDLQQRMLQIASTSV